MNSVFSVRQNIHTDLSEQWDVYQRGSDQRLASAGTEEQAQSLCDALTSVLANWLIAHHDNSVDC